MNLVAPGDSILEVLYTSFPCTPNTSQNGLHVYIETDSPSDLITTQRWAGTFELYDSEVETNYWVAVRASPTDSIIQQTSLLQLLFPHQDSIESSEEEDSEEKLPFSPVHTSKHTHTPTLLLYIVILVSFVLLVIIVISTFLIRRSVLIRRSSLMHSLLAEDGNSSLEMDIQPLGLD